MPAIFQQLRSGMKNLAAGYRVSKSNKYAS